MPPKTKQRNAGRRSQEQMSQAVPIEEHLSCEDQNDPVPDILTKLEEIYKENKESLNKSMLHLILKVCGLSELISKLDAEHINESLSDALTAFAQNKTNNTTALTLIINSKHSHYGQYIDRLKHFFKKLIGDDFQFMRENRETKFIQNMQIWISILSKSRLRYIRYSVIELMRILIESQVNQYLSLIESKETKRAEQLIKDMVGYLQDVVKIRLKDIDPSIRESLHSIIKIVFVTLQTNIVDEDLITQLFLPLLTDNKVKIIQSALQMLLHFASKAKKLKKILYFFVQKNKDEFESLSLITNRNGILSLKVLIQVDRFQKQSKLLSPNHISNLFQAYCYENYISGLPIIIEAFYQSIDCNEQMIVKNKIVVMIEIMNLISFLKNNSMRVIVINQFFQYVKIPGQKVFSITDMIDILIQQSYNHNGDQIQMKEKDLICWMLIISTFTVFVKNNCQKYQAIQTQKYDKQRKKWRQIGQMFNSSILSNIKTIFFQKMKGQLIYPYLTLMSHLFLPIAASYQSAIDLLIQKSAELFDTESSISILKEIVQIFYNLRSYDIGALTDSIPKTNKFVNQQILLKKLSILGKFYINSFVNSQTVTNMIANYKYINSNRIKEQFFLGCFVMHQWSIKQLLQNSSKTYLLQEYKIIQLQIVQFLFSIISSREQNLIKQYALKVLCKILSVICNNQFENISFIYFQLTEQQFNIIYKFLNSEVGLPIADIEQSFNSQTKEYTRMINSFQIQNNQIDFIVQHIFDVFEQSQKIAINVNSIHLIAGALLKEDENLQNPQMTVSKQNTSFSMQNKLSNINIYNREKFASNYLSKLIDLEIRSYNSQRFIFWKIFQSIVKEFSNKTKTRERLISKMMEIFTKKKMGKDQQSISLNKALLFIISEFDRIYEEKQYEGLDCITLIFKKIVKKVSKDAMRRLFVFLKSKTQPEQPHQSIKNIFAFFEKCIKNGNNVSKEQKESQSEHEEDIQQVNERNMMRTVRNGRQTRSMSRRKNHGQQE